MRGCCTTFLLLTSYFLLSEIRAPAELFDRKLAASGEQNESCTRGVAFFLAKRAKSVRDSSAMKTLIKILSSSFLITLLVVLLPKAQAVSPPPDGGYPGFNTAEGDNALLNLNGGLFNTAVGFVTLGTNTIGTFNTAVGAGALYLNTVNDNTAIGAGALFNNIIGLGNTATGSFALFSNTTGVTNEANGYLALFSNTTGSRNTAIGTGALFRNRSGVENTATGLGALGSNTTGAANTAYGLNAMGTSTSGSGNTAIGYGALSNNTVGHGNTALGDGAGNNVTTASNAISVGSPGANVNNSCFIGNIRGITTQNNDAIPVLIDSAGQLGTLSSSRRYKTDIKQIDKASECILALKPVSFRYKVHKDATPQFGLIAEEVAEVNPDLVVHDKNGEIYTVRYEAVNAMLLNEFLKEHREVQELKKEVAALTAGLQKVSAQLEMSRPTPQIVVNQQ